MGYQQDREAFINQFARVFPKAPFSVALTFLREASGSQRYNEIASSIDVGEKELNRLELADERRDLRVTMLAASIGATIETGGDPRGCPYILKNSEGAEVRVPGRGLPARCFR